MKPVEYLALTEKILADIDEWLCEVRCYPEEHKTIYAATDLLKEKRDEIRANLKAFGIEV